jgi:hypothetical protein
MVLPPIDALRTTPSPGERRLGLRVTPDAQRALPRGHPWLYGRSIADRGAGGWPGDPAQAFTRHEGSPTCSTDKLVGLQRQSPGVIG